MKAKQMNPSVIKNRAAIKNLFSKEADGFVSKFDQSFKEQIIPFSLNHHPAMEAGVYVRPESS